MISVALPIAVEQFTNLMSQIATSNVAQASCLWGSRASRLAFRSDSAGWKPAGPTAETAVPLFSNPQLAIRNPRL